MTSCPLTSPFPSMRTVALPEASAFVNATCDSLVKNFGLRFLLLFTPKAKILLTTVTVTSPTNWWKSKDQKAVLTFGGSSTQLSPP